MSTEIAKRPSASMQLAANIGVTPETLIQTVKAQCFKNISPDRVTDAQLAVFTNTAHTLNLNPLVPGMLEAFPTRNGGVAIIIGPDGVFKLLAEHPDIEGWETSFEDDERGKVRSCTVTISRKNRGVVKKTCYLDEWFVDTNPNWKARPRHMLEIRTMKQAARFVIHGIPMDADEAVIAAQVEEPQTFVPPPANKGESISRKEQGLLGKIAPPQQPAPDVVEAEYVEAEVSAPPPVVEEPPPAPPKKAKRQPAPAPDPPKPAPVEKAPEPEPEPAPAPVEPVATAPAGLDEINIDEMSDEYLVTWINNHIAQEAQRSGATIGEVGRSILNIRHENVGYKSPKPLAQWFLEGDDRRRAALRALFRELIVESPEFITDEPVV
jgi:hypothetical protein